ncbi:MAG: hypothetical protein IJ050_00295 [Clostridia bacterium]|nr:hypothetical protein [Clostridia bacterium]MBQ8942913.1 hypothetical protein [Clostridia bacterium]
MNYSKEHCVLMLRDKFDELQTAGETRYPARKDFTNGEVNAIKAFLGPWPRALEAAGIKEEDPERLEKKKQRRINQKRKKTQRMIEKNKSAE